MTGVTDESLAQDHLQHEWRSMARGLNDQLAEARARVDELTAQTEAAETERDDALEWGRRAESELAEAPCVGPLRHDLEQSAKALVKYGMHNPTCSKENIPPGLRCACGLFQALAGGEGACTCSSGNLTEPAEDCPVHMVSESVPRYLYDSALKTIDESTEKLVETAETLEDATERLAEAKTAREQNLILGEELQVLAKWFADDRDRLTGALDKADEELTRAGRDLKGIGIKDYREHFYRTTHIHERIRKALAGREGE